MQLFLLKAEQQQYQSANRVRGPATVVEQLIEARVPANGHVLLECRQQVFKQRKREVKFCPRFSKRDKDRMSRVTLESAAQHFAPLFKQLKPVPFGVAFRVA